MKPEKPETLFQQTLEQVRKAKDAIPAVYMIQKVPDAGIDPDTVINEWLLYTAPGWTWVADQGLATVLMTHGQAFDLMHQLIDLTGCRIIQVQLLRDGNHDNREADQHHLTKGPAPSVPAPGPVDTAALDWVNNQVKRYQVSKELEAEQREARARKEVEDRVTKRRAEVEAHLKRHGLDTMMAFYSTEELGAKVPKLTATARGYTEALFEVPGYWPLALRVFPQNTMITQLAWYSLDGDDWTKFNTLEEALAECKKDLEKLDRLSSPLY